MISSGFQFYHKTLLLSARGKSSRIGFHTKHRHLVVRVFSVAVHVWLLPSSGHIWLCSIRTQQLPHLCPLHGHRVA